MKTFFFICIMLVQAVMARQVIVQGVVRSAEDHRPLEGVNVYLSRGAAGTTTNLDGRYALSVAARESVELVFSYVGYAEHYVHLNAAADTTLNVVLARKVLEGPIVHAEATQVQQAANVTTYSEIRKHDFLKRYTTQDVPQLLAELPSVSFYSEGGNGIGYNYLTVRGFDQRRVAVMINGVPQNDPEDHNVYWINFPDIGANIQSIQLQRGAGNAFYGPAAIGGSINIKTDHFSPTMKIRADWGRGTFNTEKQSLYFNSGLWRDHWLVYGRVSKMTSDGYRDRAWADFKSYFLGAAYYNHQSSLRLHFYGGPIRDGLVYNGLPKLVNNDRVLRRANWSYFGLDSTGKKVAYFAERRDDETESFNQPHVELLHQWKINDKWELDNTLFYINGYGYFDYDGSWGTGEYFRLTPQYGFDSTLTVPSDALVRAYVDNKQVGWTPRLTLKGVNGSVLIGAEWRMHRSEHWGRLQKGSGLPARAAGDQAQKYYAYKGGKDIFSLYYHQNYLWSPTITIQADMQAVYKKYRLYEEKYVGTGFEVPYLFINPRLGVNIVVDKNSRAYFSLYSTGREPRLKNLYDAAEASTPVSWGAVVPQFEQKSDGSYDYTRPLVKPETLNGLDFGYRLGGQWGQMSLNVYYMDFINEIIKKGGLDRFGQPRTGNAKRTLHYGVEWAGQWNILPELSLTGNMTLSRNILKDYTVYDKSGEARDLSGNTIAGFPDWMANARLTYVKGPYYLSLSGRFSGASFTDNFNTAENKTDAYAVFNLNGSYTVKKVIPSTDITLYIQVNNLFDRLYLAYGEGDAFFPAATRNMFAGVRFEFE
ncbi:MAG: TonB-dependent receptor [Calditrichaeota bacterium]|nr:MAG: TonB-dependent receptor [Calditrichota bacterium]